MFQTPLIVRPQSLWPHPRTPAHQRLRWPGTRKTPLTLTQATAMVEDELRRLGCVGRGYLLLDVFESAIRQDGGLRSNATLNSPGVIVQATHPRMGALRWANDGYIKATDNLRAIAATIDALRGVERWRCVRDHQQFTGFKALPADTTTPTLTEAAAYEILSKQSGLLVAQMRANRDALQQAYRIARNLTHPDHHPDRTDAWHAVQQAAIRLGL